MRIQDTSWHHVPVVAPDGDAVGAAVESAPPISQQVDDNSNITKNILQRWARAILAQESTLSQSEERRRKSGGGRALVLHFYMRPRVLLSEMLIFGAYGHLPAGARIFIADYRHDANRPNGGRLTHQALSRHSAARSRAVFISK
jgi:hypothetical protein